MKYNNNNNKNNINIKKYLYCFYCLILFLMFICIIFTHIVDSVARQTQISGIKTDNLELNAQNLHMKGSVIDSNTNNINIEQLTAEDLKDTYHTHEHGVGVVVSISVKEKSLENTKSIFELKNKEYVKDDIIRSTITNTNLENINTDLSNVKETIRDQILSNADMRLCLKIKITETEAII